jgi:hypothetical protein
VVTDVPTAGSILGVARTKAYELARRDAFPVPVLRVGSKFVVPVAPMLALLGLDEHGHADESWPESNPAA